MPRNYDPYGGRVSKEKPRRPDTRATSADRGYDAAWTKLRNWYIRRRPVCEWNNCMQPAAIVDHIIPICNAPERRLDASNLQSLCRTHHAVKTARDNKERQSG